MDSFNQSSGFRYSPNPDTMDSADVELSGVLEINVHHARNIHNICIYDNQDVYAKFSLTCNPDETLSTRIINGGGKNPEFNETLMLKITQLDAVLKCEIWMLSRARNLMEDQLLGFALVPISQVIGKGKVTQDYSLSSTDLFHSPAGTVQLSLSLDTSRPVSPSLKSFSESTSNSSISSEVVLLDRKISQVILDLDPLEYSRIEFPDINVVSENQKMVSEYFTIAGCGSRTHAAAAAGLASFLYLGSSPRPVDDYEMTPNSLEEHRGGSVSPNSGFLSSTTTSLSEDRNSADSIEKKTRLVGGGESSNSLTGTKDGNQSLGLGGASPDTPTSKKGSQALARDQKDSNYSTISTKQETSNNDRKNNSGVKFGPVFSAPIGNMNLEAEQSAMQQQIVDMYMRSMHQFTESLAKMKLPMDLDKPELAAEDRGDVIQSQNNNKLEVEKKTKDGSRVFYGSRAFF